MRGTSILQIREPRPSKSIFAVVAQAVVELAQVPLRLWESQSAARAMAFGGPLASADCEQLSVNRCQRFCDNNSFPVGPDEHYEAVVIWIDCSHFQLQNPSSTSPPRPPPRQPPAWSSAPALLSPDMAAIRLWLVRLN
jgi:hypothetical protein